MDFKRAARRAVNSGVRRGMGFLSKKLAEPETRAAISRLITGQESTQLLEEDPVPPQDSGPGEATSRRSPGRILGRRRGSSAEKPASSGSAPVPTDPGPRLPGAPVTGTPTSAQTGSGRVRIRYGGPEYTPAKQAARDRPKQSFPKRPSGGYPGDFTGTVQPSYSPDLDGDADPGEVIWGWVPFEEDHSRGKDRPVLVIGHEGSWLLGLMLTSKDNVPGGVGDVHTDEHGSLYMNIGTGEWDSQGRPSEVRLDRVIRIDDRAVRREGAIMPMQMFSRIVAEVRPA